MSLGYTDAGCRTTLLVESTEGQYPDNLEGDPCWLSRSFMAPWTNVDVHEGEDIWQDRNTLECGP